jgi:hypothetical protein
MEYKPNSTDRFIDKIAGTKIKAVISFIVWSIIYKIIDMNTLQWFGKNIFVDGNVLGFFVASAFALSIAVLVLGTIYKLVTGQKL